MSIMPARKREKMESEAEQSTTKKMSVNSSYLTSDLLLSLNLDIPLSYSPSVLSLYSHSLCTSVLCDSLTHGRSHVFCRSAQHLHTEECRHCRSDRREKRCEREQGEERQRVSMTVRQV